MREEKGGKFRAVTTYDSRPVKSHSIIVSEQTQGSLG